MDMNGVFSRAYDEDTDILNTEVVDEVSVYTDTDKDSNGIMAAVFNETTNQIRVIAV